MMLLRNPPGAQAGHLGGALIGAREWHGCGVPFELLQRTGRWSSDAIASYIAGMILDVQAQMHCPASSNAGISILRMDAQLAERLSSIEAKLDQVISLSQRGGPDFVVGQGTGETTRPPTPTSRVAARPASAIVGDTTSRVRMPAVAIVSLRVKQEIRAKLHLAPPLVGKASSWQTFGCNYKFGESKYSVHAITELDALKFEKCKTCFAEPYFRVA